MYKFYEKRIGYYIVQRAETDNTAFYEAMNSASKVKDETEVSYIKKVEVFFGKL